MAFERTSCGLWRSVAARTCVLTAGLTFALAGSFSQILYAVSEHFHECACSLPSDGSDHHCQCPKCLGPALGTPRSGETGTSHRLTLEPDDCGDEDGPPVWLAGILIPQEPVRLARPRTNDAQRSHPPPPGLISRRGPAPPVPPPIAA